MATAKNFLCIYFVAVLSTPLLLQLQPGYRYVHNGGSNACCTGTGVSDYHARCGGAGAISVCKDFCDNDSTCNGYVVKNRSCQFTTTTGSCPSGFTLYDANNLGTIVNDQNASCGTGYGGCWVKSLAEEESMDDSMDDSMDSGRPDGIDGEIYCENEFMLRNEEACMASSCCHWNTWEEGEASFNGEGRCWSSIGRDVCTDILMSDGESYCEDESMLRNEEACMASSCCHWNTWEEDDASFNGEGRCWSSIGQDVCTDIVMPGNHCDRFHVETLFTTVSNSQTPECMSLMAQDDDPSIETSIDDICACLNSFDGSRFFTEDWDCYMSEGEEHTIAGYFEYCHPMDEGPMYPEDNPDSKTPSGIYGMKCHNLCPLDNDLCVRLGYPGQVDEIVGCAVGSPCFEITGQGGVFGAQVTQLKGCLNPPNTCDSYSDSATSSGVTVLSCGLISDTDTNDLSSGAGSVAISFIVLCFLLI